MKSLYSILLLLVALSSGGCATITSSENQPLSLSARAEDGNQVEGVMCALKNDKGAWQGAAPGVVSVHRSAEDLLIECRRDGMQAGMVRAVSRAAAGMIGNVVFGGAIGAVIDHSRGTGYNYPDAIPVVMGRSIVVDRRDQPQGGGEPPAPAVISQSGAPPAPDSAAAQALAGPK